MTIMEEAGIIVDLLTKANATYNEINATIDSIENNDEVVYTKVALLESKDFIRQVVKFLLKKEYYDGE